MPLAQEFERLLLLKCAQTRPQSTEGQVLSKFLHIFFLTSSQTNFAPYIYKRILCPHIGRHRYVR